MKYRELVRRLEKAVPQPDYAVSWWAEGQTSEASYSIVPLDDGRFTLYRPTGRGGYYPDVDAESNQRFFATEDDVCDFVWERATAVWEQTSPSHHPTEEESANERADVLRRLGLDHDPYGASHR